MKVSISLVEDGVTHESLVRFTLHDNNSDKRLNAQAFCLWLQKQLDEKVVKFFGNCLCDISLGIFPSKAKQIEKLLHKYKPGKGIEGITEIEFVKQPPISGEAANQYSALNRELVAALGKLFSREGSKSQVDSLEEKVEALKVSSEKLIKEAIKYFPRTVDIDAPAAEESEKSISMSPS